MRTRTKAIRTGGALAFGLCLTLQAAPPAITDIVMVLRFTIQSEAGSTNEIQYATDLVPTNWTVLTNLIVAQSPYDFTDVIDAAPPRRFYRVAASSPNRPALTNLTLLPRLKIESDVGITNQIQFTSSVEPTPWAKLTNVVVVQSPYWFLDLTAPVGPRRIYRVVAYPPYRPPAPASMALIPAGSFSMGDNLDGLSDALPVHTVELGEFYIEKFEVTKALWDEVYQWA